MKIIDLAPVTDAALLQSSVAEDDYPLWVPEGVYAVGQCVIRPTTHRIYEALVAGTDSTYPELSAASDSPRWVDAGPTNRWAMFDDAIGTATTAAAEIDVQLRADGADSLLLMELQGRSVTVDRIVDDAVVQSQTIDLDGTEISGFYDWFFTPFQQRESVVLKNLPAAIWAGSVRVRITGSAGVSCGVCRLGQAQDYGSVEYGVEVGIEDYSEKSRDRWGRYTVKEGSYSQIVKCRAATEPQDFKRIHRGLSGLRARLAYYELTDQERLSTINVLGFFKDFRLNLAYPTLHYCTLELEGLAQTL